MLIKYRMKLDHDILKALLIGAAITVAAVFDAVMLTHVWLHYVTDIQPYHVYLSAVVLPVLITPVCLFLILRANVRVSRLAKENYRLACRDALTDLPNRRAFFQKVEAMLQGGLPRGQVFLCRIADIDNFKHVNDQYGHDMGDVVLQGVSAAINAFAMKDTLVARLGGEEFSVAGFFSGAVEARLYADALVRAVEARTHRCGEEDVRVTISFGYCLSEPDETLSAMLTRADAALYAAKGAGKNRALANRDIPLQTASVA